MRPSTKAAWLPLCQPHSSCPRLIVHCGACATLGLWAGLSIAQRPARPDPECSSPPPPKPPLPKRTNPQPVPQPLREQKQTKPVHNHSGGGRGLGLGERSKVAKGHRGSTANHCLSTYASGAAVLRQMVWFLCARCNVCVGLSVQFRKLERTWGQLEARPAKHAVCVHEKRGLPKVVCRD